MKGISAWLFLLALQQAAPFVKVQNRYRRAPEAPSQVRTVSVPGKADGKQNSRIRILDENALALSGARLDVTDVNSGRRVRCTSDYTGSCEVSVESTGPFRLRVEKEGFYVFESQDLRMDELANLEVTLNHTQEFSEKVDVVSSHRGLNPQTSASSETLDREEILNLPYPTTRDFRNALPLMPGVLQDATGQIHVDGSETSQIVDQLDGFNITHPGDRKLTLRMSTDALRSIEVLSGRYSAEYGKGSGGVLDLETGMGDDRFRFSATNFIPSLQTQGGLSIGSWTPRATFSGPLALGRAWFLLAADGEYRLRRVTELPSPTNRSRTWRGSNLAKVQLNWSPKHVLTVSALVNRESSDHPELSRFRPQETTTRQRSDASLLTVREQFFFQNQALLEAGLGLYTSNSSQEPMGNAAYTEQVGHYSGNYYRSLDTHGRRVQGLARFTLPPIAWHGKHLFRLGVDVDRPSYRQNNRRGPIRLLRQDGTLSREVSFVPGLPQEESNLETSAFLEDRWSLADQFRIEAGVRFDRDHIVRKALISPRFSVSYLPGDERTKVSAGVGIFYDATPLDLLTAAQAGPRIDRFFGPQGQTLQKLAETSFRVNRQGLGAPRFVNWSAEIQRQLGPSTFVTASWTQKRGRHGFLQGQEDSDFSRGGAVLLGNARRDRYWAMKFTLRRTLAGTSELFAAFTHSSARSNAALNFDIDNPVFGPQQAGPLPWDAPDRLQVWGWRPLPFLHRFLLAYALDWRTGYPFSYVNEREELVGSANSHRFPAYFSLDLHLERRFEVFGYQWALRGGVNNATDRPNAAYIDNNIDSPEFLALGGVQGRAFTGRIRFLGHR